jgi:hypothetical protein
MDDLKYDIDDKPFKKLWKQYFSSLFCRKQRYIYMFNDTPNRAVYSTLEPSELLIVRPTIEDTIHSVDQKNIDFIKMLSVYLPIDKLGDTRGCAVNIFEVQALIREHKDKKGITEVLHISDCGTYLYVNKTRKVKKVDTVVQFPVVFKMSHIERDYIEDMFNSFIDLYGNPNSWVKHEVDWTPFIKSNVNILEFDFTGYKPFKLPQFEGITSVSISEFVKKQKDAKLYINIGIVGGVVRFYYTYEDAMNTVSSFPILSFIYIKKKK